MKQKITTWLWFDGQAEEAAKYYTSIFKNSSIDNVMRYGPGAPLPEGTVLTASWTIEGKQFVGLNGGPQFKPSEAVSFFVDCNSQEEVDYYWNKLTEEGEESQCGWLKDKYGISWQIIPSILGELLQNKDRAKAGRAMQAMLKMRKIDIAKLKEAAGDA
ncbi:MAG: VOC family protein [Saprospiraceae bacterium]|uniref:VOC family protein n=1 Tax=Candidatus Opimibacter skivensis TaxID=2982028 RepID=A0A9D7SS84_9BACT|nr:VOC family protein [Candidatus Opimibacter skivensis]